MLSSLGELANQRVIAIREGDFNLVAKIDKEIEETKKRWSNHGEDVPLDDLGEVAGRAYKNEIKNLKTLTSGVAPQRSRLAAGQGRTKKNLLLKPDNQESEKS